MTLAADSPVHAALRAVLDPVFEKPMLELGSLEPLGTEGGAVQIRVRLATPSEALRARVEAAVAEALSKTGLGRPEITWDVVVPAREVLADDPVPAVRNVVLVMSGKGGVGKSTVACNLALALARTGVRVGLLDADLYGPSIPTMLGVTGAPTSEDGKTIRPLERFGVKLMSVGFLLENPRDAVIWRGPMVHGALQQFVRDVKWEELDYLLVDCPPGTGDVALTLAQTMKITGVLLVTTPQEVALQDVYKGVSMCKKLNLPILGVVENMSFFVDSAGARHELFGRGGGAKIAEFAGAPLLGSLPIDPRVAEWGDRGTPVVRAAPDSPAALAMQEIADTLGARIALHHFHRAGGIRLPEATGPRRLKVVS